MGIDILGIMSFLADLSPLLLLIGYINIIKNRVFFILFISTITSITSDFLIFFSDSNTQQKIVFFVVFIEMFFVGLMYFFMLKKSNLRKIMVIIGLVYILIFSYEIFYEQYKSFPYWLASFTVLQTFVFSGFILYDILKESKHVFILSKPYIMIVLGYFIYVAGNLFLFTTTETFPNIFTSPGLWSIFIIANIVKNAFLCLAIWRNRFGVKDY